MILEEMKKVIYKQYEGCSRHDIYFYPSSDKLALAYCVVFLQMHSGAGLSVSEGWCVFDGKNDIKVLPVKQWRNGYSESADDYSNRYKFIEMIAISKEFYKLSLENGHGVLTHFAINFEKGTFKIEK